jgi:hypothetical protein
MEKDMVKNIYKSPRRLRAKYTHRTNLAVYALDISPLRGAAGYGVDTPFRHTQFIQYRCNNSIISIFQSACQTCRNYDTGWKE